MTPRRSTASTSSIPANGNAHALYAPELRNLAAALFQLERARDGAAWLGLYQRLVAALDSEVLASLERAFGRWIDKCYLCADAQPECVEFRRRWGLGIGERALM